MKDNVPSPYDGARSSVQPLGGIASLTAAELSAMRDEFEQHAASLLGRMIFAFSRLDTNLGLMVAWVMRSLGKEAQLKNVDTMSFNTRLEFIAEYIETSNGLASEARAEMSDWIAAADAARAQRNKFVHGRWGIDIHRNKALNVVGLPGSDAQRPFEYSLSELEAYNQVIRHLTSTLSQIRDRWRLP